MQSTLAVTEPGFIYWRFRPSHQLRAVVIDYWTMRARRCRTLVECALPDPATEIYFNLGPRGRRIVRAGETRDLPRRTAWVAGPRAERILIEKEIADCHIVGVRLQPGAAHALFGVPACELRGELIDLDRFWPDAVRICADMHEAEKSYDQCRIVEAALLHRWVAGCAEHALVRALGEAVTAKVESSLAGVAERFGLSHRKMIRLFDDHYGLKPVMYRRVARLRRCLELIEAQPRVPWARLAAELGYYDQAHLIKDFRDLTGVTPTQYTALRSGAGTGYLPVVRSADYVDKELQ
jgi:AraC-like DNA-binding protein